MVIEGMFLTSTLTVADHQQLLVALGSLSSSVEQYMPHSANCMFLMTSVTSRSRSEKLICLYPVFYVPGINHRFLSVGTLLNQGLMLRGSLSHLEFRSHESNRLEIVCKPHEPGQTIYWLSVKLASADSLLAKSLICSVDYDIMHHHFGHPSKDVLQHASGTTLGFPSITFPHEECICPRCAEGKMTRSVFPASDQRSAKPFNKIHMDLKAMPV